MIMNSNNSSHANNIETTHLKKSRFTEMLIAENDMDRGGFKRWIFCQGMLFNSPDKWWGDHGLRDYPHEGIDFCLYRDSSYRIHRINEKTRIPVLQDGVVKAMLKDYLGIAIIIEHEHAGSNTGRLLFIYAHTKPHLGIETGLFVKEGDIIGTLADTGNSSSNIIPHLHLSLGLPAESFSYDRFVWNTVRKPEMITLLDPLAVIDRPYQALSAGDPGCREL